MDWMIPGTVLQAQQEDAETIRQKFSSMFLGGGIVLSQVAGITGLEPHAIQNWVKRGFLVPPQNKRYSLRQLCRILNINMLRSALSLEQICGLLQYVNGDLKDESDDLIDDTQLYFLFIRLVEHHRKMSTSQDREEYLERILADYKEPIPGAKGRVRNVLRIMLTAWAASQLRLQAEKMICQLREE